MASILISTGAKRWINLVGAGISGSGVGWLIVHYLLKSTREFGLPSSSAEPWWLRVHGAFAFLALWTGGLLWGVHVVKAWHEHRLRWSGSAVFTLLLLLIVSGYLLYYVGDERSRALVSAFHWIAGLLLPVLYLVHRLAKKRSPAAPRLH